MITEFMTNELWVATLLASGACFILKILGFSAPESILNQPRIQRINSFIPIVLLSALVAVQTLGAKQEVVLDHRLGGVAAAALALRFKASFPVMMIIAAIVSAIIYRFA
jgi:branched-subunit amino acid transport protein